MSAERQAVLAKYTAQQWCVNACFQCFHSKPKARSFSCVLLLLLGCRRLFYDCFGTPDQREGMSAFLEKRKPAFQQGKDAAMVG